MGCEVGVGGYVFVYGCEVDEADMKNDTGFVGRRG